MEVFAWTIDSNNANWVYTQLINIIIDTNILIIEGRSVVLILKHET